MTVTRLKPTLPVSVKGLGNGTAVAVLDNGPGAPLLWIVALGTGQFWSGPNENLKLAQKFCPRPSGGSARGTLRLVSTDGPLAPRSPA